MLSKTFRRTSVELVRKFFPRVFSNVPKLKRYGLNWKYVIFENLKCLEQRYLTYIARMRRVARERDFYDVFIINIANGFVSSSKQEGCIHKFMHRFRTVTKINKRIILHRIRMMEYLTFNAACVSYHHLHSLKICIFKEG